MACRGQLQHGPDSGSTEYYVLSLPHDGVSEPQDGQPRNDNHGMDLRADTSPDRELLLVREETVEKDQTREGPEVFIFISL